jgi:hypothetical protein
LSRRKRPRLGSTSSSAMIQGELGRWVMKPTYKDPEKVRKQFEKIALSTSKKSGLRISLQQVRLWGITERELHLRSTETPESMHHVG